MNLKEACEQMPAAFERLFAAQRNKDTAAIAAAEKEIDAMRAIVRRAQDAAQR